MTFSDVSGYKGLKIKETSEVEHLIYIKEHSVREQYPEKPSGKTIFVQAIPPFVTEKSFESVFSQFGEVCAVYFHKCASSSVPPKNVSKYFKDHLQTKGYKVGYVIFAAASSVYQVMSLEPEEKLILYSENDSLPWGMSKWCQEYNERILEPNDIQDEIDAFMATYDKNIEEEEKRLKMVATEPDEEGWITVTKKGRRPGFARKESVHDKILRKEQLKKKKKPLVNFYRFQIKESKLTNLLKWRDKFEEDKSKIEQMKKLRKFKPF